MRGTKVSAYVKAYFRHQKLGARLRAKQAGLEPLQVKVRNSATQLQIRHQRLTGTELGAARKLIAKLTLTETPEEAQQ